MHRYYFFSIIFGVFMAIVIRSHGWYIRNGRIYDDYSPGAYRIKGMNWYGMEIANRVVEGLWVRDLPDYIQQIRQEGFNTLRIPFALEGVLTGSYGNPLPADLVSACASCPLNATTWDILDMIFNSGMNIILDMHRLNFSRTSPYWYNEWFSAADVLTGWMIMMERYHQHPGIMGIDVYNEPHGSASLQDFIYFCENILDGLAYMADGVLVFVNGVHWGEDFRDLNPSTIPSDRYILSPHSYGPTLNHIVFDNQSRYVQRWDRYYGHWNDTFVIMVGEWGGSQDRAEDVQWMRYFTEYLLDKGFGSCFWAWNPNSQDVRGYLSDDWRTVNPLKHSLLQELNSVPDRIE